MAKSIPAPTPQLNRLRAAAALIPLMESGSADGSLSPERRTQMLLFCEWATASVNPAQAEERRLATLVTEGVRRLKGDAPWQIDAESWLRGG